MKRRLSAIDVLACQAAARSEHGRLCSVAQTEAAQEAAEPCFDCTFGAVLLDRDFLVGEALGEMSQQPPMIFAKIGV